MNFISKLPDVGTTIFTIMSQMAEDYKAINLSQGYPDYDPPLELKERLNWHVNNGHNQYAPLAGIAALRQQCAFKIKEYYDRDRKSAIADCDVFLNRIKSTVANMVQQFQMKQ